jgi:predicted DNA binding CopG/RHH family protein
MKQRDQNPDKKVMVMKANNKVETDEEDEEEKIQLLKDVEC